MDDSKGVHFYFGLVILDALNNETYVCRGGWCACALRSRLVGEVYNLMNTDPDSIDEICNEKLPVVKFLIDEYFGRGEAENLEQVVCLLYDECEGLLGAAINRMAINGMS